MSTIPSSIIPGLFNSKNEEHRLSQEEYRQLFELVSDAVIFVDNATESILEANAAAAALYGYTREELITMGNTHLSAEPEKVRRAMLEKSKRIPLRYHRKKDGTVFPVEIVASYFERHGRQVHIAAIRDITERQRAEDALRESEERAKRALDINSTLAEIGRIVSSTLSIESVYGQFAQEIKKIIPSDRISIGIINREDGTYRYAYASGIDVPGRAREETVPLPSPIQSVMRKNAGILLHADENGFPDEYPPLAAPFSVGIRSVILAPLFSKEEITGVLFLGSLASKAYSEEDLKIAEDVTRQIGGAIASAQLFSKVKQAEEALRRSEEKYRALYEDAPVGYIELDSECRIVRVNRRQTEMLGYESCELVGFHSWRFVVEREAKEVLKAKLSGDRPPERGFERTFRRKDGTTLSVLIDDVILRDGDGRITGIRSTLQDITDRKKAEDQLKRSEERFRILVENAPDAVFVHVGEWFVYANPAALKLFGVDSPEQLLKKRVLDWIHPDGRAITAERMKSLGALRKPLPPINQKFLRMDGTPVDVEASPVPISFEGQEGVLVFMRDITERKRAEEEKERLQAQLNQAQKMESIGRLAGGVAHDFNNMLGIIIGNAEMAEMQIPPDDPLNNNIHEILNASHHSADTVRRLLAFARKQMISPVVLNVNETVEGMLKMLRRLLDENIELCCIGGKDVGKVRMDPSQVNQILANLVVNSRDAIAGVGKITIETKNTLLDASHSRKHPGSVPGEYVLLSVSDTGKGMNAEVMKHIFDPFFTTKEVGKGTGLGLATVYGIVKQNNGFINVDSELGRGTTIKMYFPRLQAETVSTPEKVDEQTLPRGNETVLLAEDERSLLYVVRGILESQGYTVLAAQTPGEALMLAERHPGEIDLLLTDVVMKEMNGRELLKRLQNVRPTMKSLFMSGYTADVLAQHGVLEEGVNFIEKPFSAKKLVVEVRKVLDKDRSTSKPQPTEV